MAKSDGEDEKNERKEGDHAQTIYSNTCRKKSTENPHDVRVGGTFGSCGSWRCPVVVGAAQVAALWRS